MLPAPPCLLSSTPADTLCRADAAADRAWEAARVRAATLNGRFRELHGAPAPLARLPAGGPGMLMWTEATDDAWCPLPRAPEPTVPAFAPLPAAPPLLYPGACASVPARAFFNATRIVGVALPRKP